MEWLKRLGYMALGGVIAAIATLFYLYFTWSSPVSLVTGFGDSPPAADDSMFVEMIELHSDVSVRPGHGVELLLDGEQTYPRLFADLERARRSVTFQVYFCQPGQLESRVGGALSAAARRGVRVLFLYDDFGCSMAPATLDSMRAAGVRLEVFRPVQWHRLDQAQHRSHVRAVVIDGRVAYTGGFGIDDQWLGDGETPSQWRETNVRFTGPAVDELQAAFAAGWAEAAGELLTGPIFFPRVTPPVSPGRNAGLIHSTPGLGSTGAERFMAISIASARRTLYISNAYFIPDEDFRRLLIEAVERGVDVRILVPGEKNDQQLVRLAGRNHYAELLRAGVRIFEYQPAMMHAKTFVVDGLWSVIGSINFDHRSLALNNEAALGIYDPEIGARMNAIFAADLQRSREVTLDSFDDRSWIQRRKEDMASLLSNVL